jgi:aldose 1-epimerase
MLPTGRRVPASVDPGPLGARTFDDSYVVSDPTAPFTLSGGGRRIEVLFVSSYRLARVYAPEDDDVVALEPMTAPTNMLLTGGPELTLLSPGERYRATFSITVSADG